MREHGRGEGGGGRGEGVEREVTDLVDTACPLVVPFISVTRRRQKLILASS